MKEEKTFWEKGVNKDVTLWKEVDDRQKKKKVTPNELRTWKEDMDNMREKMRKSCDKGSHHMYP